MTIIIFNLMMTISLHVLLLEETMTCVSYLCVQKRKRHEEILLAVMVIYCLHDFIVCQIKENLLLHRALSTSSNHWEALDVEQNPEEES